MQRQWKPSQRSLPLLAMGSLGAQSVWSTEMAFAGPFLLHLGMKKADLASVFIAGPLSGLLVQPIVGVLTDNSTSKWGRRRPALAIACVLCAISMLLLGFSRSLARILTSTEDNQSRLTIVFVVFSVFLIDFTVNAINALDRTLILDLVHSKQQSLANVWSARLSGIGSILGFFIGQNDLTTSFPFTWFPSISGKGNSQVDASEAQLRCVCILVVVLLLLTHIVTIIVAKESPIASPSHSQGYQSKRSIILSSLVLAWTGLLKAAKNLSRPVLEVFRVQFFLSMAWFPVLFYGTSWVSDIARSKTSTIDPAAAMRLGSLSMLMHACFSFACTLILPSLVQVYNRRYPQRSMNSLTALWSLAIFTLALILVMSRIAEQLDSTNIAVTTIGLTGFAWCLSTWAPYALLGILLQRGADGQDSLAVTSAQSGQYTSTYPEGRNVEEGAPLMQRAPSATEQENDDGRDEVNSSGQHSSHNHNVEAPLQSGTISGLHNISLVLPQFLMTAFTSIIFRVMQSGQESKGTEAANFGLILRLGGIAALVSSFYALRLARQHASLLEG